MRTIQPQGIIDLNVIAKCVINNHFWDSSPLAWTLKGYRKLELSVLNGWYDIG